MPLPTIPPMGKQIPRTPPKKEEPTPRLASDGAVGYPTQRLGAVTKKKQNIEELLPNLPDSLPLVRAEYKEYLDRVDCLYDACTREDEEWLAPHKINIDAFRHRLEGILYPSTKSAPTVKSRLSRH